MLGLRNIKDCLLGMESLGLVEYLEEIQMWLDDVLETNPFDINLYSAIRKGKVWNKV